MREQLSLANSKLQLIAFVILLFPFVGCRIDPATDGGSSSISTLKLMLVDDGKLTRVHDTGLVFVPQVSNDRNYRNLQSDLVGRIDLSNDHYLFLNVYQGQPCAAKPNHSVVDCFTDEGEIFQRFGMGRGRGPAEMETVNRYVLNDAGFAMIADLYGRQQKLIDHHGTELIFNITLPLEDTPNRFGRAGNNRFGFTNGIWLTESSITYFDQQSDGTWTKSSGMNLYDHNKPIGSSSLSENAHGVISRDLVGAPNVFNGFLDGHSGNDFIISAPFSGLLIRMDDKKATWVRNMVTNPMDGTIEMTRKTPNLPEQYRPPYTPPIFYLPKPENRSTYAYGLNVQDGHIINIDYGENPDGVKGMLFDFYREDDGTYLHSYHMVTGTSLTHLGVQLSGNRLYILNGDGEIVIFELTFG